MERLSNSMIAQLGENIKRINDNIEKAAMKGNRSPEEITLVAASKTVDTCIINAAILQGIKHIGENRVQECISKVGNIDTSVVKTHFIGHLQRNKVKDLICKVDIIQSVDTIALAQEISKFSVKKGIVTEILVEVNISREASKFGFYEEQVKEAIDEISNLENIKFRGLMTIGAIGREGKETMKQFEKMNKLFVDISNKKIDNINVDILSMGMSSDYEKAIMAGSTMVRIGSGIFGVRPGL